jgi:hypothetical protein
VHRSKWLENLANSLRVRAQRTGSADDRDAALAAFEEALALAPELSEVWRTAPANLGALLDEAGDSERGLDLQELGFTRLLSVAANVELITAAQSLAQAHARRQNWSRAADVLVEGLDALERLQRTQLLVAAKKAWLVKAGELHISAAEMFLRAGKPDDALVTIERGRGRLLDEASTGIA